LSKNISLTAEQNPFQNLAQVQNPKEQHQLKTVQQKPSNLGLGDLNVTFSTAPSVNALSSKLARRVSDPASMQDNGGLQSKWFTK
jgi:hypothetical protein